MPNYAGKMRYAHFAEICEICNRIYSHKTEMRCFRFYSGCGEQLSLYCIAANFVPSGER